MDIKNCHDVYMDLGFLCVIGLVLRDKNETTELLAKAVKGPKKKQSLILCT